MKGIIAAASVFVLVGAVTVYACCGPGTPPPTIDELTASVECLWPPNHKMVTVDLTADITGDPGSLTWGIVGASSSEADNGLGDGDTEGDIAFDYYAQSIGLRAERSGLGEGRDYLITVMANDIGGQAFATVKVCVPHDQGKK